MKRLIADEELMAYVSSTMTREEMQDFKRKVMDSGESDLLLYTTLVNYASHRELADELLGEDDFMTDTPASQTNQGVHPFLMAADKKKPE